MSALSLPSQHLPQNQPPQYLSPQDTQGLPTQQPFLQALPSQGFPPPAPPPYDFPQQGPPAQNLPQEADSNQANVVATELIEEKPTIGDRPVLIPQRRPGSKERGFLRAYAPSLEEHGVGQGEFLDFMEECNNSLQGSAAVQAVRVTASLVSLIPDPSGISNAVGAGIGLAAAAAAVIQSNYKTNNFLDKYNDEIFLPRGLFCLIVTHDPKKTRSEETPVLTPSQTPRQSLDTSYDLRLNNPEWMKRLEGPYRHSSTGLPPDVAPLTFHDDEPADTLSSPPKKSSWKKLKGGMNSYLDNRALAQYAVENDGDAIMKSQPKKASFRSRYLDPTHPATTGGLVGLLSGGRVTDKGLQELCPLKMLDRQIQDTIQKQLQSSHNQTIKSLAAVPDLNVRHQTRVEAERSLGTQIAGLKVAQRAVNKSSPHGGVPSFTKNILYLTIVDLNTVSQFTNRSGDAVTGADGGEGLGELFGSLVGEMGQGLVVI